jgi:hypothetical protein
MTAFVFDSDYEDIIGTEELEVITAGDTANLRQAERKATAKIKKYLLRKYDVDALFLAINEADAGDEENDTRDITLVEYTIYFTLYILFTKIAKRNVPEDRYEQYKEARDFFKDVQQDMITPGWPLKRNEITGEVSSPGIRMNSGIPLSHYY